MSTDRESPGTVRARRLLERVERVRHGSPVRAGRLLERHFGAAARGASDAQRGALWRLRGHVLRSLRRTRPAAECYARAARWYARAGDVREQGRCAIGRVDALMYLGHYRQAEREAGDGRRLLERAGDRVSLARLLNNEGNLLHRLDLPERALGRYREARRLLARAGDAAGATFIEGNLANCYSLIGRLGEARRHYLHARDASRDADRALDALRSEYNLAYLDFLEHRYERALRGLAAAGDAARRRGYPSLAALATLDRAEIFLRMGAHDEALAEALRAIEDCGAIGLGYERAKAETFAALAEFRLGQPMVARERLERTLDAFHAEGNAVWIGEALVGLATLWERTDSSCAAALLSAARLHFARAADHEREACALALLVRARVRSGRRASARTALAALRRRVRGLRGSARLRHLWLAAEAAAALAEQRTARARALLTRAARESERLAARVLDEHWRATFWGEWGWPHRELAMLELREGRIAEAFEALERGRGRALVGGATLTRGATGSALPARVRAWAARHYARDRERAARPEAGAVQAARTTAPVALRRALHALPPRAMRTTALQSALPDGVRLVDYVLHEGALSALSMTRGTLEGHVHLASEGLLGSLVHSVLFALRTATFTEPAARTVEPRLGNDLAEIASLALWPVLEGGAPPRGLALAPVGPLARLPWAALPMPDGRALCASTELTLVPGLRLGLARPRGSAALRAGARPLIVAADVGELESVTRETESLAARFPTARVLSGAEATVERFLSLAPEAAWIHFAGHGHYQAEAPHESGVRLADRWLFAGELAELRLPAQWITLSACQTARALVRPGEEWFGLARTLLLCGAGAVVASQWDIEDQAAARFMIGTYDRIAAGASLSAALSATQVERLQAGAHPLEWAGFVLLGGPRAIEAGPGHHRRGRRNGLEFHPDRARPNGTTRAKGHPTHRAAGIDSGAISRMESDAV